LGGKTWTRARLLAEMERIGVVIARGGKRMITQPTPTQRAILGKFGLTEDDLKARVARKRLG
jgi:hypothetical protein